MNCEPGQAAVCWIDEYGELHAMCLTPQPGPTPLSTVASIADQLAEVFGVSTHVILAASEQRLKSATRRNLRRDNDAREFSIKVPTRRGGLIRANIAVPISRGENAPMYAR